MSNFDQYKSGVVFGESFLLPKNKLKLEILSQTTKILKYGLTVFMKIDNWKGLKTIKKMSNEFENML